MNFLRSKEREILLNLSENQDDLLKVFEIYEPNWEDDMDDTARVVLTLNKPDKVLQHEAAARAAL